MRDPRRVRARKLPPVYCPFCKEKVPKAKKRSDLFSVDPVKAGTCVCGASFVYDPTGLHGGDALLDVLTLATGDLSSAMKLQPKKDYRLAIINESYQRETPTGNQPKIWFVELRN